MGTSRFWVGTSGWSYNHWRGRFCSYDMVHMECPLLATAPFAYVRFHGAEERYASNYSEEMLREWGRYLGQLAQNLTSVYLYFNNDYNAKRLAELLGDSGLAGGCRCRRSVALPSRRPHAAASRTPAP